MMDNKNYLWYCKHCNRNYSIVNKKQHLLKNKHILNVLNKKFGTGLLDDPIDNSKLPEPLIPSKYVAPKQPKRKWPRVTPKKSIARVPRAVRDKVRNLIEEITPYYEPEKIRTFKKLLKFIPDTKITEKSKALKGNAKSFQISIVNDKDPVLQLSKTKYDIANLLEALLKEKKGFKFQTVLQVVLSKQVEEGKDTREPYFNSKPYTITNPDQINEALDNANENIWELIAKWISEGSGWVIEEVKINYVNIVSYVPLQGSSYIQLPVELRNSRKGLINLKNEDKKCLAWCLVRYLHPVKVHPERIYSADYKYLKELDFRDVTFPVSIKDMDKIERQNSINISVFVYSEKTVYPLRVSKQKFKNHVKLLWIEDNDGNGHYVLITDIDRFLTTFTKHHGKKHFCMHCLKCCSSQRTLEMHQKDCIEINGTQAIKMPKEGTKIYFQNYQKMLPVPFVIYADFEAITEKIDNYLPSDQKSYTTTYQNHRACSYGYKVVCHYDNKYSKSVQIYRGEDAVEKFIKQMFIEVEDCKKVMRKYFNKPLKMTSNDELDYRSSVKCHICERKFNSEKEGKQKVRDHCHITGKYRGAAHSDCNLKWKISTDKLKIPVVFHNLKGYDCHHIMQNISKLKRDGYDFIPDVIAQNFEKYIAFKLGNNLTFIDSLAFMSMSLDKLSSFLTDEQLIYTKQAYPEHFNLVSKKGTYPYDYIDSFSKFNEKSLPSKEDFYSILYDSHISDDDYSHAQEVWKTFNIKDLGEYHDLYLKTDILLLSDVFENFRKTCLEYYRLDPAHYFSAPGLSWDALLKMSRQNLDLISDIDQQLFIEKGMRGGISYIAHRYAAANNKYMKSYDTERESSYIMYLDANNLYGWGMSQSLPFGNFKWIDPEGIDLDNYTEDTYKGIILEVDLEYPEELHDLHNDYPLAPEKLIVPDDTLSSYCKTLKDEKNISSGRVAKLIPTLNNRERYVIHYKNLQLYLKLGLKLTKIHRVLEFSQKPWMKRYIDFNTEKRKLAKNSFEKEFFKLMNNSVYGKTMENLRLRSNIKLETDVDHFKKLTKKPTFVSAKIFDENLVGVQMKKEVLTLNKPSYVGFSILEMSKTLMYDFHYNYIKNKYVNSKLLFTDTDSLVYRIKTDDVYEDFYKDRERFDNSDYDTNSKFYYSENKKVIGKFKDEAGGKVIEEFVGLKSKMYSFKTDNNEYKKAKGVKKCVIKNELKFSDYKNVLENCSVLRHKMNTLRSDHHNVYSYHINKISLSPFDDKRYILDDGITSYAYGNKKIEK